jgi:periplasmic divalent cation tolerance protein
MTYCVILVTSKDVEEAERIANKLLEEKLAACVNILKDVQSLFWWDGNIDRTGEVMLVIKTRRNLFNKVAKAVKMAHSYDVPEVIALPIVAGDAPYLKWINSSTKKGEE